MAGSNQENFGFPVMVGLVPLFCVTSFILAEGYEKVAIPGSSIVQLTRPSTKKITLKATLPGPWRAFRPALEAMALTSRALAAGTAPLLKFTGLPVVTKTVVAADMQITSLTFTQDSTNRDTLVVDIVLEHAPRSRVTELIAEGLDLALGVASPILSSAVPGFAAL
ncbi:MAG TPA: hypothetical protein PK413_08950 [Thermoanaerobaculia bacterium]|nr:hypothetical protein [Thermoanaerobaculia bacterium]